jgi:hypothetical protein
MDKSSDLFRFGVSEAGVAGSQGVLPNRFNDFQWFGITLDLGVIDCRILDWSIGK